jgi:biotin operon repressor
MERSELREDPRLYLETLLTAQGVSGKEIRETLDKLSEEEMNEQIKKLIKK